MPDQTPLKCPYNGVTVNVGDIVALNMSAGLAGTVAHVGIYVGMENGKHKMVHNYNGVGVELVNLVNWMGTANWWVRAPKSGALPGEEVASRARSRIGERNYNFIYNNCEHFANWCKYGHAFSEQADGVGSVPILGPILGMFSGMKEKK